MVKLAYNMKTGKTTRIIDRCIQQLFEKGTTFVYERGTANDIEATNNVFEKFIARINLEHPHTKYHYQVDQSYFYCYKIRIHNL